MKFRLLLLALFLAFQTTHAAPGFVHTQGKKLVTAEGAPLLLKGVSIGNWLLPEGYMWKFGDVNSPRLINDLVCEILGEVEAHQFWKSYYDNYITRDDIQFLKKSGFNSVRIPFDYRLFVLSEDPDRLEGPGYALLDRVIGWCKAEGLYVVLDMHAAPGGQTGANIDDGWGTPFLFDSPASQQLAVAIWRKLAQRYRDEPAVIGYDLLNEPIAPFTDTGHLNPLLEPLYKKITAGIREVDPNHVIFLGGAQWDKNFDVFGPPFDKNVVYTFHLYWMIPPSIQRYLDFREKYGVPLWLGESGEITYGWISRFRTLLETNDVGWCFWPYKKMDSPACIVSVRTPSNWDKVTAFAAAPRATIANVHSNRHDADAMSAALRDFLEQVKFQNCTVNKGYLEALGLH